MLKILSGGGYFFLSFVFLMTFCFQQTVHAQQTLDIPEPLTLQYALSRADLIDSPEMMSFAAQQQIALAEQELAHAQEGIYVYINGRLRYVEPSKIVPSSKTNDSKLSLDISKRLFDFGQTRSLIDASKANLASVNVLYSDYLSQRKVAILQAYFNVLLADIIYSRSMEAMSVAYVRLDKLRSEFELGKISDIELLKSENDYRSIRREQIQAQSDQRLTRHRLAQLITPGYLPDQLEAPDLKQLQALSVKRDLQDIKQLTALALEQNPRLLAIEQKKKSAHLKLEGYQAEKYPVIEARLQAADYARELGTSDKYRAGIEVSIPLYQAGQENAKIKRTTGELVQLESDRLLIQQEIEQQILELWLKISDLKRQFDDPDFTITYRDLYLDRSRALYELEVTSDLGDAMVKLSDAQLYKAQTVFELAIAWAKLDALVGNPMNYYK